MSDINVEGGDNPNNESAIGGDLNEKNVRSNSSQYNEATRQSQLIHEQYASAYNHHTIIDRYNRGTARDLDDEPKVKNTGAFIIGSGPSLDDAIPYLKDWEGGIVCTTSHALTFIYHGIEPTHIFALDPFCRWDEIDGIDWSKTRTKLIAHPGVWPDLIEKWPNDIIFFRQNVGRSDSFYSTVQKHMYSRREGDRTKATFNLLIKTDVTQFACSPPAQMFAADRLGYSPIFLTGVDFGYHSGKNRFTNYTVTRPAKQYAAGNAGAFDVPAGWEKHENPLDPNGEYITTNNGLKTEATHLYYKKNFLSAWRLSLQNVWTTDKNSIMTEIPYAPVDVVVRRQGKHYKPWKPDKIKRVTETYLASVGAFVIVGPTQGIMKFVESENPDTEIHHLLVTMNAMYKCPKCSWNGAVQPEADPEDVKRWKSEFKDILVEEIHPNLDEFVDKVTAHFNKPMKPYYRDRTGEPCPECKEPIVKFSPVDIDDNMIRIHKRIDAAAKL